MCGIAGIVGNEAGVSVETVHRMCQTIVHRGPDDEGIYVNGSVGLGMRRLSIIDVAGGHQPVHNEDRSVWTVFNGEIYNFPELRPELEKRGHRFYTHTDTEVIVHLYEDYGADCVQKLRGMFAFAVYDEKRRLLLLARDRLGIKPLHYVGNNGRLLFGSEIKAILAAAPELGKIDPQGTLDYFHFGYIPDPLTAFKDIKKLPPGCVAQFAEGKLSTHLYWDLPRCDTQAPRSEEEILKELERLLAEAVRIRMVSDVPLGALLSGGVDSSIVVALMARYSGKPVKTFTIAFRNEDYNEAHHARLVAERFGTEHHELLVEPNILETLEYLTHMLEEPFADSSMIPTLHVCQMASKYVTVALSGDGGDEFFAGYDRYRINYQRRFFEIIPGILRRLYRERIYHMLPQGMRGRKFTYNVSLPSSERYLDMLTFLPGLDREFSILTEDFRSLIKRSADPLDTFRYYFERAPMRDRLSSMQYLDAKTYLTGDILTKVDRMSMTTSLEARVPLLDHVLAEYVTSLPPHLKLHGNQQKYILKKVAERIGVPPQVLHRPKQGFAVPLDHWLRGELKKDLLDILLEPRTLQRGYLQEQSVRNLLKEHLSGRRNHSGNIWLLLIFELWHRNFLEKLPTASSQPDCITVSTLKTGHESGDNDASGHTAFPATEVP
ncbi:MAG TPA: asparagine synthase (glutamine-hydrolyzing) [Terriglobia bacterium]|nr:asparagine synthase (glutamine-hydrolyzing) [Terriglobia bacterium]